MSKKKWTYCKCEACLERKELRAWMKALMTFENLPVGDELDFYDKWWWDIEKSFRE